MRHLFYFCLPFLFATDLLGQAPVIVLQKNATEPDQRAARVLQFYLQKICGATVNIEVNAKPAANVPTIIIGKKSGKSTPNVPTILPEDAFFIESKNQVATITGGGKLGTEYGVYLLLEKIGCRKYTPRDSFIPEMRNFRLPDLAPSLEIPAFPYRELWYEPAITDAAWARWHRLKTNPDKEAEWGMFVHTFEKLCPYEQYYLEHPEYFSWNGKQYLKGQLCLSNDTVRQIVIAVLREKIKEKPDAIYWSVSQNDNYDYCKCARCAASDQYYGGQAGTLLAFVNAVAAEFPEKTISTLAYQYTRQAPRNILPAGNVSICLCSIECNRGLALTDDPSSAGFVKDVQEWAKLTSNLMMWDYVVQFRSYLSPFPNWHTLQPNLRFFQKNGVKMMFEQGSGRDRSEFSDMRAYLLANLMWNPAIDADSILQDFTKGYYGPGAPAILAYLDSLEVNLLHSDRQLQIYGTPLTASNSWLNEKCFNRYFTIFDKAIQTFPEQGIYADHLTEAMIPLLHVLFEQFKIREWGNPCADTLRPGKIKMCYLPAYWNMVKGFPQLCAEHGYQNMNENRYSVEQYAKDMIHYFEEGRVLHQFLKEPIGRDQRPPTVVSLKEPAAEKYAAGNPDILIDSRRGTDDYHYNWLGFYGNDMTATVTIPESVMDGQLPKISTVSVQFLQDQQSWVFFPETVILEISVDGKNFTQIRKETIQIMADGQKDIHQVRASLPTPQAVRAVRVTAINQKDCPAWHACSGNPAWIFADEIVVD